MRKQYRINGTDFVFSASKPENISQAIKLCWVKKHKLDPAEVLNNMGIIIKPCGFCGKRTNRFNIEHVVAEDSVAVIGVNFDTRAASGDNYYCYGSNPNCPGKKLNPNSVEFVAVTMSMTPEAAKAYIHTRNKSPFYRTNHPNAESYIRAQSRSVSWFSENGKDRDDWISKANYSRSKEGYIQRYGHKEGAKRWVTVQKQKARTLSTFVDRYGDRGEEHYLEYLSRCNLSLDNFVKKYGEEQGNLAFLAAVSQTKNYDDLVNFAVRALKKEPTSTIRAFPAAKLLTSYRTVEIGLSVFGTSMAELISDCMKKDPTLFSIDVQRAGGKFGNYISYTKDGQLLRSGNEIAFYTAITRHHPDWVILANGKYPNSNQRYDFYFPEIDVYVEIAGLMEFNDYEKNILRKKEKHNCLVIKEKRLRDASKIITILEDYYARLDK